MKRISFTLLITIFSFGILEAAAKHPLKQRRNKNYWKHVSHRKNAWKKDADYVNFEPK